MGSFSIWHWLVVLAIVVIVFGTKRLRNVGEDVGEAVKGFKKGMRDEPENTGTTIEHKPAADSTENSSTSSSNNNGNTP